MRHLTVTLRPTDGSTDGLMPILGDAPFVETAQLLQWNVADRTRVLYRIAGEREPLAAAFEDSDLTREYAFAPIDEREFYAYVDGEPTETQLDLWRALSASGAMLVPPVEFAAGPTVTARVVGAAAELRDLLDALPDGLATDVEQVGGFEGPRRGAQTPLTDRQRTAIEAAIDLGYYDVPRNATAADVAERLDCSPSTASEHLRRAEARVMTAQYGN